MEKGGTGSAIIKSIILVVLGAIIVLGLYLLFTRNHRTPTEETYDLTVVDEITTTNLERNYPASARKVVELYARTMQVLYKEEYSEEQENKMIDILMGIMDEELLTNNLNFASGIKSEITGRKAEDYSISNYVMTQAREPEEINVDGRMMCTVECLFSLRHGSNGTSANYYEFIMRRDETTGNWKILGWTLKAEE
ncbi:MAG: hypothetical protein E7307_03560 [Butyrivibrio sp.]|nr:hypothetical protein [Butyrivibrio sp.]